MKIINKKTPKQQPARKSALRAPIVSSLRLETFKHEMFLGRRR
jgi:hypothetical protein